MKFQLSLAMLFYLISAPCVYFGVDRLVGWTGPLSGTAQWLTATWLVVLGALTAVYQSSPKHVRTPLHEVIILWFVVAILVALLFIWISTADFQPQRKKRHAAHDYSLVMTSSRFKTRLATAE